MIAKISCEMVQHFKRLLQIITFFKKFALSAFLTWIGKHCPIRTTSRRNILLEKNCQISFKSMPARRQLQKTDAVQSLSSPFCYKFKRALRGKLQQPRLLGGYISRTMHVDASSPPLKCIVPSALRYKYYYNTLARYS